MLTVNVVFSSDHFYHKQSLIYTMCSAQRQHNNIIQFYKNLTVSPLSMICLLSSWVSMADSYNRDISKGNKIIQMRPRKSLFLNHHTHNFIMQSVNIQKTFISRCLPQQSIEILYLTETVYFLKIFFIMNIDFDYQVLISSSLVDSKSSIFTHSCVNNSVVPYCKRESLRKFYRGHFCLKSPKLTLACVRSLIHQQVCRGIWKSILSQMFFREKTSKY